MGLGLLGGRLLLGRFTPTLTLPLRGRGFFWCLVFRGVGCKGWILGFIGSAFILSLSKDECPGGGLGLEGGEYVGEAADAVGVYGVGD